MSLGSDVLRWGSLQTIYQFLNRVDRPSKTGDMMNNVRNVFFAHIIGTFAACLVQEETLQMGFSPESVHKQEVFARKITCSYWWKKAPHQPITKFYSKTRDWVVRSRRKLWEEQRRRLTAAMTVAESDRDR